MSLNFNVLIPLICTAIWGAIALYIRHSVLTAKAEQESKMHEMKEQIIAAIKTEYARKEVLDLTLQMITERIAHLTNDVAELKRQSHSN